MNKVLNKLLLFVSYIPCPRNYASHFEKKKENVVPTFLESTVRDKHGEMLVMIWS